MPKAKEEPKAGVPMWLVSFGDMMTLILTFFILLVSMASTQDAGLVADGLGSFVVALNSHGLDGFLDDEKEAEIFNEFRRRFNLPEEQHPDRRAEQYEDASNVELVKAKLAKALEPHNELNQPLIATFEPDSSELTDDAMDYLDRLAETIKPGMGQVLNLEGHSSDAGPNHEYNNPKLAYERASAVRKYLIRNHGFAKGRVSARGWLTEIDPSSAGTRGVDARLITPDLSPR